MSETSGQPTPYQRVVEKAFSEAIPLNAQFEITYRCNHLCSFCYNSPTGQREMTTPQIFEALRKMADFGVLYLTLTGGEALCHKDFFKIAAEVRRLGMALRIYTNGYLMADRKVVKKIKDLKPFEVEVTVHGGKAESLGLYVTFDPVITPKDDGNQDPLALRADEEFFKEYWAEHYAKLHGGRLPPRTNHCAGGGEANCGTGRSGFTVDPYGNIFPCVALRRQVANILEIESFQDVWTSSPVLTEVRDLAVEARGRLDRRPDGAYFQFCPGVAETQMGDPLAVYPQAEINAGAIKRAYEVIRIEDLKGRKSA